MALLASSRSPSERSRSWPPGSPRPRAGDRLKGRYLLRLSLRTGGSDLWRGLDLRTRREVEVETLPGAPEADLEALRSLPHPGLVPILDLGSFPGGTFVVTPAEGGDPDPPPAGLCLQDAVRALRPIAEALDHLHQAGRTHAGLNSHALVRTADGLRLRPTAGAGPLGAYLSPERLRGAPASPASDRWALAVLLYEAMGERPPFVGPPSLRRRAIQVSQPLPLAAWDLPPSAQDEMNQRLLVALSKDPRRRPPSAVAWLDALDGWVQAHPSARLRAALGRRAPTWLVPAAHRAQQALGRRAAQLGDAARRQAGVQVRTWTRSARAARARARLLRQPWGLLAGLALLGSLTTRPPVSVQIEARSGSPHAGEASAPLAPPARSRAPDSEVGPAGLALGQPLVATEPGGSLVLHAADLRPTSTVFLPRLTATAAPTGHLWMPLPSVGAHDDDLSLALEARVGAALAAADLAALAELAAPAANHGGRLADRVRLGLRKAARSARQGNRPGPASRALARAREVWPGDLELDLELALTLASMDGTGARAGETAQALLEQAREDLASLAGRLVSELAGLPAQGGEALHQALTRVARAQLTSSPERAAALTAALEADPTLAELASTRALRGALARQAGDHALAMTRWRQAVRAAAAPTPGPALDAFEAGVRERAQRDPFARLTLTRLERARRDLERDEVSGAMAELTDVVRLFPEGRAPLSRAYVARARRAAHAGDVDLATALLKAAVDLDARNTEAHVAFGDLYAGPLEDPARCLYHYRVALGELGLLPPTP